MTKEEIKWYIDDLEKMKRDFDMRIDTMILMLNYDMSREKGEQDDKES